jgi:short-subunit dehydrogenase
MQPFGVSVSIVEPGPVETGFFDARWGGDVPPGSPYAKMTEQLIEKLDTVKKQWVDVADVGHQVERLLTATKPAFRVIVGYKNKAQVMVSQQLPESWWREIVRRAVGLG